MSYITFFLENKRLISFGFLLTFFSSFGQTFLISLYVPKIVNDFQLSNAFFGGMYALATVVSSFILIYVGKLIDKTDLRIYTLWSAFLLLLSCLMMAISMNVAMIFVGLLGLRFSGQGLMSHISSTAISKYFDKSRGKALSITALGYSSGEGFFPLLVGVVISYWGWRYSLLTHSAAVAIILIPFVWFALPKNIDGDFESQNHSVSGTFSSKYLFRDKWFYLLALNVIMLPFLVTGLFFYQSSLANYKQWSFEWLTLGFIGFAIGRTIFSLLSGLLIDTWSAVKLLPVYLLPILSGMIVLLLIDHPHAALYYLFMTGISVGLASTIKVAAMAEIYGATHLGAIKSIFSMLMVLGTAISPLLFGWMIDNGYTFFHILWFGIGCIGLTALLSVQFALRDCPAFSCDM